MVERKNKKNITEDICEKCGCAEHEHHKFRPRIFYVPNGCECYYDFDRIEDVGEICDNFEEFSHNGFCVHCNHDEICHSNKKSGIK